jgi:dimeric dUTPase (all-alpha-NTP-PPase superfamily)
MFILWSEVTLIEGYEGKYKVFEGNNPPNFLALLDKLKSLQSCGVEQSYKILHRVFQRLFHHNLNISTISIYKSFVKQNYD